MYQVGIVGGGTAGLFLSKLLSEKGIENVVFEEHEEIGLPIDCTGLLGPRAFEEFDLNRDLITGRLKNAFFHLGDREVVIRKEGVISYLIDREEIEKTLARGAKEEGAILKTGTAIGEIEKKNNYFELESENEKFKCKILVGADGAFSLVGRKSGLTENQKYTEGLEYRFENPGEKESSFHIHMNPKYSKKRYAWLIKNKKSKIGVMDKEDAKEKLDRLAKELGYDPREGGLLGKPLPTRLLKKFVEGKLVLVGDAAGQIYPLVGGGIYLGMKAAEILSEKIEVALETGNFEVLREYEKEFKSQFGKELKIEGSFAENYPESVEGRADLLEFFKTNKEKVSQSFELDNYDFLLDSLGLKSKLRAFLTYLKWKL